MWLSKKRVLVNFLTWKNGLVMQKTMLLLKIGKQKFKISLTTILNSMYLKYHQLGAFAGACNLAK